ncbi:E3 ubiquitin/ISG15 ligase TRIM25-like [Discoglossus pictus]
MASDLREELNCSICLHIYTDPVTLSCGHNFCQVCIGSVLDTQEGSGVYICPECRKIFNTRPELQRNLTLCNIVKYFPPNELERLEIGIFCTYCIQSPVPATKSCLMCEASLCDNHVRVHSKSDEHVLSKPTTSWGHRKCSIHKDLLKYYCSEDATCICVSCTLVGEHRGHQVELLNEASEKKNKKLRNLLEKLSSQREDTERSVQHLQEKKKEVQESATAVTKRVTALLKDIKEQLEMLEKRALSEITRQEEQVLLQISDMIQQLEKENEELSKKMCHIEEVCKITDPLIVLQEQESHNADFSDRQKGDDEDKQKDNKNVPVEVDLDEGLISETLYRGLDYIVADVKVKRWINVKEDADILLDINTAANNVTVSEDCKTVSTAEIKHQRLGKLERFQCAQVLSINSFSSGQHFWEVETSKSGTWSVGVCYPSIKRRGDQSQIGCNNQSWCLSKSMFNTVLSVSHNSVQTPLPPNSSCHRYRISLDYEAGRLSFYELCHPIRHLHTFTATFTEPLHAVFYISWGGSVRIQS